LLLVTEELDLPYDKFTNLWFHVHFTPNFQHSGFHSFCIADNS